jgi:hypothetical protein
MLHTPDNISTWRSEKESVSIREKISHFSDDLLLKYVRAWEEHISIGEYPESTKIFEDLCLEYGIEGSNVLERYSKLYFLVGEEVAFRWSTLFEKDRNPNHQ